MIDDAAKTAPISPCQRPRSRGGTMLPITASESGKSPPAPMPWTARKTTSCVIVCARPQSAEPSRKTTIAKRNRFFRPQASPSLPYSGTVTVEVSMYAVKTHEYCVMPPRSPTIRGSAVATIVWSSAASISVTIRPE